MSCAMTSGIAIVSPLEVKILCHNDTPYVIVDARPHSDYAVGHIPRAIWLGWDGWCEEAPLHAGEALSQAGYWGVLKDSATESLGEHLEQLGLSNDRPVIVYADGPVSKGREGRIAWMLLYLGVSSVSLLNGGWSAWLKYGGSVDVVTPAPKRGHFRFRVQEYRRIQFLQLKQDYQRKALPPVIDVRSRAEFEGYSYYYQPRLGRIPGALHMPFTQLFDDEGNFVTKSAYLQRLSPEVRNADRLVAYCEVGVRSCLFALLHEAYTGQVIANFDGSVMEWALDEELPIESDAL